MEPEDIRALRRSKLLLVSRIKPQNFFPGERESTYVGEGLEFAAIRSFEPGDDLRDLDLHSLATTGEEDLVERVVERRLPIYVWVDVSGSMQRFQAMLFSQKPSVKLVATALLVFSASNGYSPVGLAAFASGVQTFFPAKSGLDHADEIMQWVLDHHREQTASRANFHRALAFMMERVPARSLVFLVSDFQDAVFEADFTSLLRPAAGRFDLVPVVVRDPLEKDAVLKRPVRITVHDSEGESGGEIYLTPERLRTLQRASADHMRHLADNFRRAGAEHLILESAAAEDCTAAFSVFFGARRRMRG